LEKKGIIKIHKLLYLGHLNMNKDDRKVKENNYNYVKKEEIRVF